MVEQCGHCQYRRLIQRPAGSGIGFRSSRFTVVWEIESWFEVLSGELVVLRGI